MPVHDTPRELLDLAIASVMNHRSRFGLELVICDDGCSRRTRAALRETLDCLLAAKPRVRVELVSHSAQRGPAAARNSAAAGASGDYLLWLDSDDELVPGAVDALVDCALDTGAEMVIGRCSVEEATGLVERDPGRYLELAREHRGTMEDPLAQVVFSVQPQLVLAEAFRRVGGFDPTYRWAEVTEFFLRFLGRRGLDAVAYAPVLAYACRRRKGSLSSQRKELMSYRRRALRAYGMHYLEGVTIEEVAYLGRSPETGAQHFRLFTGTGAVQARYEREFLPSVDAAAEEAPGFLDVAQQPDQASRSPIRRLAGALKTGLAASADPTRAARAMVTPR